MDGKLSGRGLSSGDRGRPLLATKFRVPPARPNLVARPRLTGRLDEGTQGKLALISAPAGFGKTTLLAEWSLGSGLPVAWVSLDRGDNDIARFLAYLVAALGELQAGVGENALALLGSPRPLPNEAVLTALVNEIAAIPDDFALVLDDYHLISTQPVHDAVAFLLEHLPSQAFVVIASRTDPPLPLARLLAGGHLTKLSAADLRFTPEEAADFLSETVGLSLSPGDVESLERRTEGWIAGLQLAALSMRGGEDVSGSIATLTGSHRYVLDYLAEEVLGKQSQRVQHFLLETSVLDRLSGPLCDAVTGRGDGQEMLEKLERENLFLLPLDDERRWYRYHHLFSDFLRSRLHGRHPERVSELHRQASEWYERSGLADEAVHHALAAEDHDRATRLIVGVGSAMLIRFETATLMSWLRALPEDLVLSQPQLCSLYAAALFSFDRFDEMEPYLRRTERLLGLSGDDPAEALRIFPAEESKAREFAYVAARVSALRAYLAKLREDLPRVLAFSHTALELWPEDYLFGRGMITGVMAFAHRESGDLSKATRALHESIELLKAARAPAAAMTSLYDLAHSQTIEGRLRDAAETYQQALRTATEYGGGPLMLSYAGVAHMGMGALLREWNDLEAATRELGKGMEPVERFGVAMPLRGCYGYVELARVKQAQGDAQGALEAMHKAKHTVQRDVGSLWHRWVAAWQARLWVAQGNLGAAYRWEKESGLSVEDRLSPLREFEHVTLARLRIAQDRHDEAVGLLERLLEAAEDGGRTGSAIEILTLLALALQARGDERDALAALRRALSLAEPEGYVRTFVDEGAPMAALLKQLLKEQRTQQRPAGAQPGVSAGYVGKLLAALADDAASSARGRLHGTGPPVEILSERELEVLSLLDSDLSNREIAAQLYVSLDTVKSHLKHVYGKLGVRSRRGAVARARELGLL